MSDAEQPPPKPRRRPRERGRGQRGKRVNLRLSDAEHDALEKAAALHGTTLAGYVSADALSAARDELPPDAREAMIRLFAMQRRVKLGAGSSAAPRPPPTAREWTDQLAELARQLEDAGTTLALQHRNHRRLYDALVYAVAALGHAHPEASTGTSHAAECPFQVNLSVATPAELRSGKYVRTPAVPVVRLDLSDSRPCGEVRSRKDVALKMPGGPGTLSSPSRAARDRTPPVSGSRSP